MLDTALELSRNKVCVEKTVNQCRHNETIKTTGDIPSELEELKENKDLLENTLKRNKRSDVELPGK